jgi:predicted metal-binding protein
MAAHPEPAACHHVFVCMTCRDAGADDLPGAALLQTLHQAFAHCDLSNTFTVSGVRCMAGCTRSCTVGFAATGKAAWLFGDLRPEDCNDIVAFAGLYASLKDGWCSSTDRPGKLSRSALARIPSLPPRMNEGAQ